MVDEDMGFARIIVDACEDHITYEDRCLAVRSILVRHRIAAGQRGKIEGARLAIEAAAKDAEEWFPADTSKRYPSFGVVASIRALDPAKIVGEG